MFSMTRKRSGPSSPTIFASAGRATGTIEGPGRACQEGRKEVAAVCAWRSRLAFLGRPSAGLAAHVRGRRCLVGRVLSPRRAALLDRRLRGLAGLPVLHGGREADAQ